jgi:UDP-N-acetylglucosamine acyltransferase
VSADIHPTAVIEPGAVLGEGCRIGPYCIVGAQVTLGPECRLHSHVVLGGETTLGARNEVFPFACIGLKTQDLKWKGGRTRVEIGDDNVFREYVTIHSATSDGGVTRVGSGNNFLAYCHVAHDVQVGNRVVMSNVGTLAGHVVVGDHAVIGGLAAVHQFCRIGAYAMIGGCSKVVQDVPPGMLADGNPAEVRFINKTGLERNGFTPAAIDEYLQAFKILFRKGLNVSNALAQLTADFPGSESVAALIAFVRASERGISK